MQPSREISRLVEIMAALRDPDNGCPWDLAQDFSTIRHYTIEEAYEVADAIERQDFDDLLDELGDLLLQPVYHAQLAAEEGYFDFNDVIETITTKLVRRHPHVFGDVGAADADAAKQRWDEIKAGERATKNSGLTAPGSLLDDVPFALPALARANKLAKRAAEVGFDWPDAPGALDKVREELGEVKEAMDHKSSQNIEEELGDLLMAVANLARKCGVDPEAALTNANAKFLRRFTYVEKRCREEKTDIATAGLEVLDGYWNEIRGLERVTDKWVPVIG
ncbi:MAG: nucleoside triphosphate pyrophosphohydrolase [Alphaproteobacteria bacterium]|nr:nucleoside triphosphate pyrophosphohydrolase [Alphaproteobacteria bacterium]